MYTMMYFITQYEFDSLTVVEEKQKDHDSMFVNDSSNIINSNIHAITNAHVILY